MATRFADHLPTGDHASRPAAGDVPEGTLYACSDHTIVYQSDGSSTWSDWFDPTGLVGGDSDGYTPYYDPDRPPSGLNAASDEFDDSSLDGAWTWDTAPGGSVSESQFPGYLHINGGTDSSATVRKLRRAFVPGAATAFSIAAKVSVVTQLGNFSPICGIYALDNADAVIAQVVLAGDGTSTSSKGMRVFAGSSSPSSWGTTGQALGGFRYLLMTRSTGDVYLFYWSNDGIVWNYAGTITSSTTVSKVAFAYGNDTDALNSEGLVDFVRVFDSVTRKIGDVPA